MPKAGDSFEIKLKETYLGWGTYRKTDSRPPIKGEGYIPIPLEKAKAFGIFMSNYEKTGLGYNLFNCESVDGLLNCVLKAAGNTGQGEVYAKQFQGNGNLKVLGEWYSQVGAEVGDTVKVTWMSPFDIEIELIKK